MFFTHYKPKNYTADLPLHVPLLTITFSLLSLHNLVFCSISPFVLFSVLKHYCCCFLKTNSIVITSFFLNCFSVIRLSGGRLKCRLIIRTKGLSTVASSCCLWHRADFAWLGRFFVKYLLFDQFCKKQKELLNSTSPINVSVFKYMYRDKV